MIKGGYSLRSFPASIPTKDKHRIEFVYKFNLSAVNPPSLFFFFCQGSSSLGNYLLNYFDDEKQNEGRRIIKCFRFQKKRLCVGAANK